VVTYTLETATIDEVKTFSDVGLSSPVETITVSNVGTGLEEATSALDLSLYTLGTTYYLKVTWTPSGAVQRFDSFPFLPLPQGTAAASGTTVDTTCKDGTNLQAPALSLRLGLGGYRLSDFENGVDADALSRYEAEFPIPDDHAHKQIHFLIGGGRGGAPWSPLMVVIDAEAIGDFNVTAGQD
jgi:hypothetical protein